MFRSGKDPRHASFSPRVWHVVRDTQANDTFPRATIYFTCRCYGSLHTERNFTQQLKLCPSPPFRRISFGDHTFGGGPKRSVYTLERTPVRDTQTKYAGNFLPTLIYHNMESITTCAACQGVNECLQLFLYYFYYRGILKNIENTSNSSNVCLEILKILKIIAYIFFLKKISRKLLRRLFLDPSLDDPMKKTETF